MTTGTKTRLKIDNEYVEVVDSFCPLGSHINSKGTSNQGSTAITAAF